MKRLIKIITLLVVVVFLVGLAGFFILPPVIKKLLIENLSQTLHRSVAIEDIKVNPWELSVTVRGLSIKETSNDTPFVSFEELYVNAEGASSLVQKAVVLKEVHLSRPVVHINRKADGSFNFSDLLPKEETKPAPKEEKSIPFYLNNIKISNGAITFKDEEKNTNHDISDIDLSVPFVSNMEKYTNVPVEPQFSARINGSPLQMKVKAKPFDPSRETSVVLDLQKLDIPFYMPYVPAKLKGRLVSAFLSASLNINFMMGKNKPSSLMIAGTADLSDISFDDMRKRRILRFPAIQTVLQSVLPLDEDIHLSRVIVEKPEIVVERGSDGQINLLNILPRDEKKSKVKIRIDELNINRACVSFFDNVPVSPVKLMISPLDVNIRNFSTEKNSAGTLEASLTLAERKGAIAVGGTMVLDPLKADLGLDMKNIAIRTFQSYFNEKVKINVTRGTLSSKGNLSLSLDKKGDPKIEYNGIFSVSDFASVDKVRGDPFLNWKQLYFDGIHASYNSLFVNIRGISLTDYFARIIINPDGTMNIQNIFVEEKEATKGNAGEKRAETIAAEGKAPDIKIGKVTFQGGSIDFSDNYIKPNYSARMHNLSGSISGLSSMESSRATVDLRGNLGYGSPIEITGKINPLIKNLFADMKVSFKNIELNPMTPYSSKFLGHPIVKGKLTYDAEYLIDRRKLDAKNKVFIDQLTFGDRVESPDAIKAPVKLAVTLLSDRNGQIDLDIPVSGSLDDPEFSVWPIVWRIIVNLITKAATAPFALLASLTGGGEEMGYIEFEYGSAQVAEADGKKIAALVKVLTEKPALKMDIEGRVDEEKDLEGLKVADLKRKIKAQKLNDLIKQGKPAIPVERIQIEPQEYEKYLTLAYEAAPFPKPRTVLGTLKSLPPAEMEKLMLTNTSVTEDSLRQLAIRRAERVKTLILSSGTVSPERVFIVESAGEPTEKRDKVKKSRVDIKLK